MATRHEQTGQNADPLDGWSLPSWTYSDAEFFEAEKRRVFAPAWQVVCHTSDIPDQGDWHTLDYLGESVVVARGKDGEIRAFTNVCRHRGSRILDGASGCARKFVDLQDHCATCLPCMSCAATALGAYFAGFASKRFLQFSAQK